MRMLSDMDKDILSLREIDTTTSTEIQVTYNQDSR